MFLPATASRASPRRFFLGITSESVPSPRFCERFSSMSPSVILVIDDDPAMTALAEFHLKFNDYEVFIANSGTAALALAEDHQFGVVLTDLMLPDMNGIDVVKRFKAISPDTEIIVITAYSTIERAVEATKAGAFHFVEKPVKFEEILILVERALERRNQSREIIRLRNEFRLREKYFDIIGASKAMQNIYEMIECVAESDANVLIIGESGTGKELVANAIHYRSQRAPKPFIKVNCTALPRELIESELFGHARGSFTGATHDKVGVIGQAHGGSLLLDEISEMPPELQPKLLRVLQERVYYRVGGESPKEADFRLISATNRNPRDAIREGHLREDLFYRINTIEIQVPPLRERADDIHLLAEHFLAHYCRKYNRPELFLPRESYELLFNHRWPGNVRELQNTLERVVLMTRDGAIDPEILAKQFSSNLVYQPVEEPHTDTMASVEEPLSLDTLIVKMVAGLSLPGPGASTPDLLEKVEALLVRAVLERTRGNKQAAANLLGLYRPRLYSLIKKHRLTVEEIATPFVLRTEPLLDT